MMADSSSDIEAIDILDPDSLICGKENGVLNKTVSSSDMSEKPLKAISDLKEMDVNENSVTDNSNQAIDLSSDEDASKNSSPPEIKTGRKVSRKMKPTARNRIPPSKNDGLDEFSDVETVSSTSENHKDLNSNLDDDKTESDAPMDVASPMSRADSDKQSCKDVETSSMKSHSIPDRLYDTSPKCSPELIVADDGPLERFKLDTNVSSPAPSKADGENEASENSSKAANEASSKKSNSKDDEPESKPKSDAKSEGKKEEKKEKKKGKTCPECGLKKKLHFRIVFQGKSHQMCSETCYKNFKQKMTIVTPAASPKPEVVVVENCIQCQRKIISGQGYYPLLGDIKSVCSEECLKKYHDANGPKNHCSHCKSRIESVYNQLTWETMIFCNEDCLGKYQSFLGSHCTCCQSPVQQISLGKYCVCFGADIRQFCSGTCLDEFKKNLKVCSYCQTDLSAGTDGFLAPVGEKGQFKDFCSQNCMERYEVMNNLSKAIPEVLECSHCKKQGSFKIHVKYQEKTHSLCCDICVAGFRCTNKLQDNMCNTCFNFFKPTENENFWFQFEGSPKHFCAKACMTLYVLSHRKIIQCVHCKVKKYTFDMIEKVDPNNQIQMFCSLNCLSLYRVNLNAASAKCIRCDHCSKSTPAQYHLTMSDGSIRNFCSYQCVLNFQNQFSAVPALTTTTTVRPSIAPKTVTKTTTTGTSPVIVSAISLANHTRPIITTAGKGLVPQTLVTVRQQAPSNVSILTPRAPTSTATMAAPVLSVANASTGSNPLMREIVVRPPAPKSVKNKSASCKPIMQTKGVNAKLQTCHKAVQTDERPMPIILPVPVPIYVPTPMHMFSRPIACPVPFPVPLPVPVIMHSKRPTKDKQDNTPSQSFEDKVWELPKLVSDKATESQGSKEATSAPPNEHGSCERVNQTDDLPQTEDKSKDKNVEIEKTSLNNTVNTTDNKTSSEASCSTGDKNENLNKRKVIDEEQSQSKKPKFELTPYSFGPDAWSQWTEVKNQEKELSRKLKYFKKDLLYLSAEDLNHSLGVFVQDFKRCEGHGYTASTLFYLCLSIQLYLSENGRMDNIFTDKLYESFINVFHDFLSVCETKSSMNKEHSLRKISEDCLWSARQLGAHSPQILLNTLIYFNTKYFKLNTDQAHANLHFNDISRQVKKTKFQRGGEMESYLVYFNPFCTGNTDDDEVLEQAENSSNALRCPVKLYEFYLSKCPSIPKENNSRFYLAPEKNCLPDGTWYSLKPLSQKIIKKALQRYQYIDELCRNQVEV